MSNLVFYSVGGKMNKQQLDIAVQLLNAMWSEERSDRNWLVIHNNLMSVLDEMVMLLKRYDGKTKLKYHEIENIQDTMLESLMYLGKGTMKKRLFMFKMLFDKMWLALNEEGVVESDKEWHLLSRNVRNVFKTECNKHNVA